MHSFTVNFPGKGKRLSNFRFNSKVCSVTKRNVHASFIQSGPEQAEVRTESLLTIDEQESVAQKLGGELKKPPAQNESRVR